MSLRADTFGSQLLHFARSVDIVSDVTMERARDLVSKYVDKWFGAKHFEFMREQEYEDGDGKVRNQLTLRWSSATGVGRIWPIRTDGSYTNPVTMSFDTNRPLCLVAADRKPLRQASSLVDKWSNVADVPLYRPASPDPQIHTLIAVPVHYRRKLGVYYFETTRYINPTVVAKEEFLALGQALGILLELWYVCWGQSEATKNALDELGELLTLARYPKVAKPHVFLAYSDRADGAVVQVIRDVLKEFSDRLEFTDWKTSSEPGAISAQIRKSIAESPFGICYLSERATSKRTEGQTFVDNPNVLFEAGMLHARSTANESARWIAVREQRSAAVPFDLADTRFVLVPRHKSTGLDVAELRTMLARSLSVLLEEPPWQEELADA